MFMHSCMYVCMYVRMCVYSPMNASLLYLAEEKVVARMESFLIQRWSRYHVNKKGKKKVKKRVKVELCNRVLRKGKLFFY